MKNWLELNGKKHIKINLLLIIVLFGIIMNILFIFIIPKQQPVFSRLIDLEVKYNNESFEESNYLITEEIGRVSIISYTGEEIWKSELPAKNVQDAEFLPNGNILIADTGLDRVIEVDRDNSSNIVWSWDAGDFSHFNWTEFGIEKNWSKNARDLFSKQANPPKEWININGISYINGSSLYGRNYNSILITLGNFDMIIEINHSVSRDLIWSFGSPFDNTRFNLDNPRAPKRLANGIISVSDIGNERLIEMRYSTKYITKEFKQIFPNGGYRKIYGYKNIENGTRLICDSGNSRIILVNDSSKNISKTFKHPKMFVPVDVELIDGTLIVGDFIGNSILFFNYSTGVLIDTIGRNWVSKTVYITLSMIVLYNLSFLSLSIFSTEKKHFYRMVDKFSIISKIVIIIMSFSLYFVIANLFGYFFTFS